jgi:C4-type Zn-finger protein
MGERLSIEITDGKNTLANKRSYIKKYAVIMKDKYGYSMIIVKAKNKPQARKDAEEQYGKHSISVGVVMLDE